MLVALQWRNGPVVQSVHRFRRWQRGTQRPADVVFSDHALAPSAACGFSHRAQLYRQFDAKLQAKTRFFGAACATNEVLSYLVSSKLAPSSSDFREWLSALGAVLETNNLRIAENVRTGRLDGPTLDSRIVSMEQTLVQKSLRKAAYAASSLHARRLGEFDALLNQRSWLAAAHFNPLLRWYGRVVISVRRALMTRLEFAIQEHREAVGMALIAALQPGASARSTEMPPFLPAVCDQL